MFWYDSTHWAQSYRTSCQILLIIPHMPSSGAKENSLFIKKKLQYLVLTPLFRTCQLDTYYSTICHPTLICMMWLLYILRVCPWWSFQPNVVYFKVLPVCIANNWIYFTLLWDRSWEFLVRHKNHSLENLYKLYSLACNCSTSTENIFQIRGYKENLG